jgi:hypothetical protein
MQIRLPQFVCRRGLYADQHSSVVSTRIHRRCAVSEGIRTGEQTYRRAKEGGIKRVSTTAHYVTTNLDEAPIIEHDVVRVDHRHASMTRRGPAPCGAPCSIAGVAVAL